MSLIFPFPVLLTNFKIVNVSNSLKHTFERQVSNLLKDLNPKR